MSNSELLSDYKNNWYANVQRNYEFMKAAGIIPKLPAFMQIKSQQTQQKEINILKVKLDGQCRTPENVSKLQGKDNISKVDLRDMKPREFAQIMFERANLMVTYLEEVNLKEENTVISEKDLMQNTDCEDCSEEHKGVCPIHGPMLHILDTEVPKCLPPSFLSISNSRNPKAGLGVWAEAALQPGMVFGPYRGEKKNKLEALKGGYSWMIRKGSRAHRYSSNWFRFVNCATAEDQQNLVAIQYRNKVYYRVYKPVLPFTELLAWYGKSYSADLMDEDFADGINLQLKQANPKLCRDVACEQVAVLVLRQLF